MFKSKTTFDLALRAVDLIDMDLDDLVTKKEDALSIFQATADGLEKLNADIDTKVAQCTSLIATLSRIREELEAQFKENENVRSNIRKILGIDQADTVKVVLDDKGTLSDGSDDVDTAVEE